MKAFEDIKDSDIKKDIIIDGLMRSNGVYLLVSKPKVGKSMFALQLADSIAIGKPFLGYKVLKPSPVLYITTEVDSGQLKGRCELLGISFNKSSFFVIDRDNKSKINMMDIEYQIQEFAHEYNGKILIIDMLKDVDFNVAYDINSYQDIAQILMPRIRSLGDKYGLTILLVHHLNKLGKTLGSTGFDAVVDGIFRLNADSFDNKIVKLEVFNRDFPDINESLKKDSNQIFSIIENIEVEHKDINLINLVKYAQREKEFDFVCGDIINKANLLCTPTQLGRLINSNIDLLKRDGLHLIKRRTSEGRKYFAKYIEPNQEFEVEEEHPNENE